MKKHIKSDIIERARHIGTFSYKKLRSGDRNRLRNMKDPEDYSDSGLRGMRSGYIPGHGVNAKQLADNLGPIQKFLFKNIGRPWDKVWSEICTTNDSRGIRGWHLRDHVFKKSGTHSFGGEVAPHSYVKLCNEKSFAAYLRYPYHGFWIDKHGILRHTPGPTKKHRNKLREKACEPSHIELTAHSWIAKINGTWFRCIGIDPYKHTRGAYDRSHGCLIGVETGMVAYRKITKQALNRKELQKHRLVNDSLLDVEKKPHSLFRPWDMRGKKDDSGKTKYTF